MQGKGRREGEGGGGRALGSQRGREDGGKGRDREKCWIDVHI